jgi:hypothetical protein
MKRLIAFLDKAGAELDPDADLTGSWQCIGIGLLVLAAMLYGLVVLVGIFEPFVRSIAGTW